MQVNKYRDEFYDYVASEIKGIDWESWHDDQVISNEERDAMISIIHFIELSLLLKDGKINNLDLLAAINEENYDEIDECISPIFYELKNDKEFANEFEINTDILPADLTWISMLMVTSYKDKLAEMTPNLTNMKTH